MTPQELCDYLNDLVQRDPEAITALMTHRTPCNDDLCAAPDTPTWPDNHISVLGVICGIFGYNESRDCTNIVAWWTGEQIQHFFVWTPDMPPLTDRELADE